MGPKQWVCYLKKTWHLAWHHWSGVNHKPRTLQYAQIVEAIHHKTLGKLKIKKRHAFRPKGFLGIRKQFKLKQGILYRKLQVTRNRARLQLVLPTDYRQKAMAGCHDQIWHLGQDRVSELLRDRFYCPGMHMDVASYINSCPRCIRRKSQLDVAPLHNIEATQPLELIHLDYLQIEPSKGNIENVLIVTDHFTRYAQHILPNTDCSGNS